MKIKFSHIIRNLIFILLISLTSCEKELYEDSIQNSSRNLTVQHIKLNDIEKAISNKIENKISAIKKSKELKDNVDGVENRFEYNSNLDIYIDTENGKLVNDNGKISYTFPMFRKSEEKLENIVFVQTNSNDIETYIAKYNIKPEIFKELTISEQSVYEPELQKIYFNTWWIVCIESVEESQGVPINQGEVYGVHDYETVWNVTGSICYMIESGGGDNGGGGGYPGGYNNSGNTGGNVGGGAHGGGYGTGSNGVSTSPTTMSLEQTAIKNFFMNITPEQNQWITSHPSSHQLIVKYLSENIALEESQNFIIEWIDYLILNNNQNTIQDFNNIIQIMTNGSVNGIPVTIGPDTPITNMSNYLSCFDTSQGAIITIYADQPSNGSHCIYSLSDGVGNAFISIQQSNNISTFGFYPQSSIGSIIPNTQTPNPADFYSTPGVFGNNQGHTFDVSLSIPITASSLANLINGVISIANNNPMYNIGNLNCTDFSILLIESNSNIDIPSCESPSLWQGQTPGTLGEVLTNMQTPSGCTKNTSGGNAPNNNCN